MKVRVKFTGRAQAVDVGDIEQCTLLQLQQRTADVFELGETTFSLSLNRKDALSGEDLTLSTLGVVPGDLIFVLCSEEPSASPSAGSSGSNGDNRGAVTCDEASGESGEQAVSMSEPAWGECSALPCDAQGEVAVASASQQAMEDPEGTQDRHRESPCPLDDPEVNRCLQEPLLCREATATGVPALLTQVYGTAHCALPGDALWILLHTLMLEVGFRPCQDDDFSLEEGWNSHGFYKQAYRHLCVGPELSCSLIGVPMGQVFIVHGVTNGDPPLKTEALSLKVSDYVQDYTVNKDVCSVYNNLERLSRTVKDMICQRLLSQLSEVCGFPLSVGLLSLSYELKLKVLSYLGAEGLTRVGQVCRDLSVAYKDPCLWRRLYLREFGQHGNNTLNKNWYQLFKDAYQLRRERRELSRHRHYQMMSPIPPWLQLPPGYGSAPPLAPPHYPGGLIGGDYDLNPEFTSSIPHPLSPGPQAPFLPHLPRPRFDPPFGPGPHVTGLRGPGGRHSSSPFYLGGQPRFF